MEKINLVNFIYEMIFAGVKFEINSENLDVYFPQDISDQREEEFYNFISANKEFIKSKIKYLSNSKLIHIDDIDEYELSSSQKSLWFAEQYETKSSPLNISIIFKLLDEIYLSDIKNSILKIINRHIPLSSIIEHKDDGRIFAKKIQVNNIDIEEKIVKESDIEQVLEKDILYKFDLSKETPIKLFFYKQNNENYLAIIFHHIAFDGWSVDVFFKELKQYFYEKSLPDLKANYIDYLLWQDNCLKSADSITSYSYWSNKLKDYLLLNFYRDKRNSDINNFAGIDENFLIEETDAVIMKSIAAEMGVSLYSLILSCYVLCLSAFTKQNDIILGTPLSNREDILTENLIGFFVNLMPVRVKIDSSNNFEDLARDVSYQIIEMQENQDIPLEKILDKLNIKPENGKHPIFSAIFGLQSFGDVKGENGGLALDGFYDKILVPCSFDNIYKIAKFDLSLFIDDSSSTLKCSLNYSTGVFEKDTITSFINCFRNIISQIIKNINIKISEIALVSDESCELYSRIINDNGSDFEFESLSKIFFRTCELYKKKNAIISNEEILSYAEIEQIVQINSHLIASSTNEVYCGVLIKRSVNSIIAALSILVSGKAFVTIDPSYPLERIEYIIDDLGLKIIFTEKEIDGKLKALLERKSIQNFYVNRGISERQLQVQNSTNAIDQNDAYVIYTSGSTGNPKGVIISQLALANYIFNLRENNLIAPNDIVDCSSNMCFDFTITTSIAPILLGATISVYEDDLKDIENYTNYLKERGVNVLKLIPFYFENIIQKIKDSRVSKIILGGEKISQSLRDNIDIYLNGSKIKIYDEYGPTEATVGAFISEIFPKKNNTIGHPYKNFKAYVLDEHLRFVPSKAIGELYLSGVGLAKAYVNNTFETNNRFLNNKFNQSNNQYSRMYKTGDLVRWREDGNIEYIGRIDSQVKVSGYRIEIGEIEYAIKSYGDVKDAAVVFYNNLLLAYIAEREFEISAIEIQQYLEIKLPNYLIPSEYFFIEEIPVTHNGKIDYKSLIEYYKVKKKTIVPPATEKEKALHKIWCEVLNLKPENLGINDNFFILGGDSIKSILLVNKIKRDLGLKVSVKDIFLYKTIELISRNIKEDQREGNIISEQGILNGEFNLLPIQKWFFLNNFSNPNYFNQSILINVPKLEISLIKQAINLLTEYHDAFRLAFKDDKQIYLDKPNNQFHFVDLNKDKRSLEDILSDFHMSLDINNGKVASFAYIEGFSDRRTRIFIVMHHLIVDYFSMHIIVKDLENLYYYIDLPLKGTSYRQWVNSTLTKNISEEDKNYWRDISSDIKREIFSNYLSSVNTDFCFEIDKDKTLELLECSNKFDNTKINHLILTAISISISNITCENIIHICNEQHGRENFDESIDISRTVGWFTVMHPCRLSISDDMQQNIINAKESLENLPDTRIFGIDLGDQISNYPQILFNYLGKIEGDLLQNSNNWFLSDEQTCRPYDIKNISIYQLEINCLILQNRLKVNINATLNDIFLKKFQHKFALAISKIISHINSQKANLMTPSDIGRIIDMSYLRKIQDKFEVEDVFLANSLQEGMIFHNLGKVSNDNSYIVQEVWSNKVVIDSEKYKSVWEIAQSKYPSLRLAFFWDKEIIQVVAKNVKIDFRFIELNSQKSYRNISEILKSDLEEEYNLSKPGLFRVYLVKMSEDEFITILSIHHIIIDGWSIHCLINSVFEIYEYLILNSKVRISYDEAYKEYQRKLQSNLKENNEFWKEEVAKIDRQRRTLEILAKKDTNYNINAVENQQKLIEGQLYESLIAYCRERNLTLNSLIHYAWHKTYSIFSYSSQGVVGAVISGRNSDIEGIEDSVGLFINTVPVIVDHTPSNNYDKDIEKFQNHLNELNQRFNYRLSDITDSNEKLFDSIFVFENYPVSSVIAKDNFKFEFICTNEKTNYPIAVICFERDKSIAINIQYKPNLYCKSLINNILENYTQIISDIVLNHKFNAVNGLVEISDEIIENRAASLKTINELFEEVVLKSPDKIAIFGDKIAISYMDLHKRANQLANYIRKKYSKSKNIAISLDRSSDIVITILAILKSRRCYIPIDVKLPSAKILELIESSDANLVITNDKYLNLILGTSVNYIFLDKEYENISQENIINPLDAGVFPDSPAYIKYTSGSTGKPKGVQISHISVVNLVKNNNYFIAKQDDTFAYHSNISFDAVTFELFGAILNGAKVLIIPDNKLIEYLEEYKIDIIFLTTALFRELLDNYCHLLTKIKNIFYGGEKIILNIQSDLLKNTKITHVYGPTECTTFSTFYDITLEDSNNKPIGKNILGAECYVLDLHLNKVPFGAVGELYISGIGLASGYYRDAAATSQKFIANPFSTESFYTSRMYKTGDIVQLLDDGNISFITRIDHQVKIRGRRIELPEIEYAINKLSIVQNSAACVIEENDDKALKKIIAFVVPKSSSTEVCSDNSKFLFSLRSNLQEGLASYMIPDEFVLVSSIPLNKNSKVDFSKLITEYECDKKLFNNIKKPKNQIESIVLEIVIECLGINAGGANISTDTNIYSIGFNSIRSIKLLSKLNNEFSSNLKLADIFTLSTIELIADRIQNDENFQVIVKLNSNENLPPIFMIHPGAAGCEVYSSLAKKIEDKFYAIGIDSYNLNSNKKLLSLNKLSSYYLQQMSKFINARDDEQIILFGWSFGGQIALEIAFLLESQGAKNINIIILDSLLYDDYLREISSGFDFKKHRNIYINNLRNQGHEENYLKRISTLLKIESDISRENISGKLKSLKIIFLKAMKFQKSPSLTKEEILFQEYVLGLKYNNIDKIVDNLLQIKSIELDLDHSEIIKNESKIISILEGIIK